MTSHGIRCHSMTSDDIYIDSFLDKCTRYAYQDKHEGCSLPIPKELTRFEHEEHHSCLHLLAAHHQYRHPWQNWHNRQTGSVTSL